MSLEHDNPHTHVLVRGKDETGKDLVIARDYISHGFRLRASELATEWLGRRDEREIQATLDGKSTPGAVDQPRHSPQTQSIRERDHRPGSGMLSGRTPAKSPDDSTDCNGW